MWYHEIDRRSRARVRKHIRVRNEGFSPVECIRICRRHSNKGCSRQYYTMHDVIGKIAENVAKYKFIERHEMSTKLIRNAPVSHQQPFYPPHSHSSILKSYSARPPAYPNP